MKTVLKFKKKITEMSIFSAPNTAKKNKTQFLVQRLKARSSDKHAINYQIFKFKIFLLNTTCV